MITMSERSAVIARVALENLSVVLGTFLEGDQPSLARGRDEIRVAISELGTFNVRMQVLYEKYFKEWGLD